MFQRPSRTLWIAAIAVSLICIAALAYALIVEWDTEPSSPIERHTSSGGGGSGFGLGLLIGIGTGITIGSLIALRKRQP